MASPSAPTSAAELKKALLADPKASTNEGQAKAKAKAKDKKKVNPVAKQMLERRQKKIKAQEAMKGVAVPKPAVVDEAKVEEAQAQLLRMLEEEEVRRQAREEKRRDRRKKGKERKKGAGQAQEDEDLKEAADDEFDPQEAQKLEKVGTMSMMRKDCCDSWLAEIRVATCSGVSADHYGGMQYGGGGDGGFTNGRWAVGAER